MVTQDLEEALADSGHSSKLMRELTQAFNQRAGTMEVLDIRERTRKDWLTPALPTSVGSASATRTARLDGAVELFS